MLMETINFDPSSVKIHLKTLNDTWAERPNELAILLSSSRSEVNVKDKFCLLYSDMLKSDDSYMVVREWSRRDLAIVKVGDNRKTRPVAIFEFKLRHTCFIAEYNEDSSQETGYNKTFLGDLRYDKNRNRIRVQGIKQDIEKLKPYINSTHCYSILGGLHPKQAIPKEYNVFKPDNKEIKFINDSFQKGKFSNANEIREKCEENVQRFCDDIGYNFFSYDFDIGKALGVDWQLALWVIYNK